MDGNRVVVYPTLIGKIAEKGISKRSIAKAIGVTPRALHYKLNGQRDFGYQQTLTIRNRFFPGMDVETLFKRSDTPQA